MKGRRRLGQLGRPSRAPAGVARSDVPNTPWMQRRKRWSDTLTEARTSRFVSTGLAILAAALIVVRGDAAAQASPYLHLDHPAYAEIDLLLERGVLLGLSPIVRPYLRADIARAVAAADTLRASGPERRWIGHLRRLLSRELAEPDTVAGIWAIEAATDVTGRTHAHRDVLRPQGRRVLDWAAELDMRLALPGVVAHSRLRHDNYYVEDPQVPAVAGNRFIERAEDAYVEVQGRYARLFIGRLNRNWAPSRVQGTLLSDYAYSFDQVALRVGSEKISVTTVAARLDDFPGEIRRFLALHRLDFQPSPNLALYAAEAVLYAGVGRSFELEFLNPVSFWFTENENLGTYRAGSRTNNVLLASGFWWRAGTGLVVYGDFTLDDVTIPRGSRPTSGEPPSYAFYVGVVLPYLGSRLVGRLSYAQVSNLSYRSVNAYEPYSFRGIGLARDFSDYDRLTMEVDWLAADRLRIAPRVELLRRGEGDFRQPWPTSFDGVETVLSGTVERTVRLALGGRYVGPAGLVIDWDVGQNFVTNETHQSGVSGSQFVARLVVQARIGGGGTIR